MSVYYGPYGAVVFCAASALGAYFCGMTSDFSSLLAQASALCNARNWPSAHQAALGAVTARPADAQARFLCGLALVEMQRASDALVHLREAAELEPSSPRYAIFHARALAGVMHRAAALEEATRAQQLAPDDALTQDTAGVLFAQCGFHDHALTAFHRAVHLAPGNPDYRFNLGTSLAHHGKTELAEEEFEQCLRIIPGHWRAHHSLSQLRKQTPQSNHLERLRSLLPQAGGKATATAFLRMALAKELEDLGEYDQAFEQMQVAKAAPHRLIGYCSQRDKDLFQAVAELFPDPGEADTLGHPSDEPVFVFGMPRSGTTLIERILSSHPQVQAAGELRSFPAALKQATGTGRLLDADAIARIRLDKIDWQQLGSDYLESTRPLTGQLPHFTDKLPQNFLHAGFIAKALPNARLVVLRRDPLDTCLSNFRLLFAPESPYFDYSYDLLDVGRYYIAFNALIAHWKRVLPGRILEVHYESIVEEQETNTRRLLEFCGLEWDDACLQFHSNRSAVATASAAQVRKPLYRDAMHRWKRYQKQLVPLQELLEDAGITCSD